jgi:hypothetical protein
MSHAIEIIDAAEMAARLRVKVSWIVEESKPSRTSDQFLSSASARLPLPMGIT